MNDDSARGANDVRFTSDLKEDVNLEYPSNPGGFYAEGSFEILKRGPDGEPTTERVRGMIAPMTIGPDHYRLMGIHGIPGKGYTITDLRTGTAMASGLSHYTNAARDAVYNMANANSRQADRIDSYEQMFKRAHARERQRRS